MTISTICKCDGEGCEKEISFKVGVRKGRISFVLNDEYGWGCQVPTTKVMGL